MTNGYDMRILQIVPSISLIYGGPSQMVLGLAPALASQGIEVTVLTTNSNGDTGQEPLDVPLNITIEQEGYKIVYFRCSPFRRYKFSLDLLKWLNNHSQEFDVAHIHALFSPVSSAAAWVCRQKNLPYILRPLGTLDPADLRKKKQLKKLYVAMIERANLAGAAAVHFTSEQEAKVSERFGIPTRDLVIPLGVRHNTNSTDARMNLMSLLMHPGFQFMNADAQNDSSAYPEFQSMNADIKNHSSVYPRSNSCGAPILLFMSRIDPKKGLNLLIPALEKLLTEGLQFHFVLAGTNPQDPGYEEKIRLQIEASPLRSHATITGFVTGEIKAALLQAADIFVLPSYYENFGIAVAEAMVAGTPVIISDQVHIWQEVQDSESGWVGATDVEVLTNLIKYALEHPEECQRRGLNAQKYALTHYSWNAIARQMIAAYQEYRRV
jgi:glycosyltransferase involved in cell wall biosynthesis